jgi:hypothetical protein
MMSSPARRLEAARAKYPALGVAEILIWREYLKLHEAGFDTLPQFWLDYRAATAPPQPLPGDVFDYNLRIGQGNDPGAGFDPSVRQQWIEKTKFRVDAVGFKQSTPWLFEVDRNASSPQVGQLLSYLAVWRASHITPVDPVGVLVTSNFNANAMHLVREANILLVTVPVDFRVLSPYSQTPITGTEGQ